MAKAKDNLSRYIGAPRDSMMQETWEKILQAAETTFFIPVPDKGVGYKLRQKLYRHRYILRADNDKFYDSIKDLAIQIRKIDGTWKLIVGPADLEMRDVLAGIGVSSTKTPEF